jgi:succinate dehydrogenase / fumarate reductase membrane anchor subunit
MPYITARKQVAGLGAAGSGTDHFWKVTISSVALVLLVPLFVFTFGPVVGEPYAEVAAYYSRPFPALVAVLTLIVGWWHFAKGAHVLITDYTRGMTRKVLIIAVHIVSYAAALAGLYALARLAL